MPGPIVANPIPDWLKPENASVTDSALTKAMRMIGHLIGADNPTSQVLGLMMSDVPSSGEAGGLSKAVAGLKDRVIKAYHGSPHDFERFSLEKIGTGEGAQAYGHGLYFAENPTVAEEYKKRLSGASGITPGASQGRGKLMVGDVPPPEGIAGHRALDTAQDIQGLLYYKQAGYPDMAKVSTENIERRIARWKAENPGTGIADSDMRELVNYYETHVKNATPDLIRARPPGKMYEVAIHADPEDFLDWDKPLSQQSEKVRAKLLEAMKQRGLPTDETGVPLWAQRDPTGEAMHAAIAKNALPTQREAQAGGAEVMKQVGIPGIKYLDQGSRGTHSVIRKNGEWGILKPDGNEWLSSFSTKEAADAEAKRLDDFQRTRNYVVFDDRLIDILKKYGLLLPAAGAATEGQTIISPKGPQ